MASFTKTPDHYDVIKNSDDPIVTFESLSDYERSVDIRFDEKTDLTLHNALAARVTVNEGDIDTLERVKANQTDLDETNRVVATKADQVELNKTNARVTNTEEAIAHQGGDILNLHDDLEGLRGDYTALRANLTSLGSDYADLNNVAGRFTHLDSDFNALRDQVNNLGEGGGTDMSDYAKRSELANYALKSSLSSYLTTSAAESAYAKKSEVADHESRIADLEKAALGGGVDLSAYAKTKDLAKYALKSEVSDFEERIAALESGGGDSAGCFPKADGESLEKRVDRLEQGMGTDAKSSGALTVEFKEVDMAGSQREWNKVDAVCVKNASDTSGDATSGDSYQEKTATAPGSVKFTGLKAGEYKTNSWYVGIKGAWKAAGSAWRKYATLVEFDGDTTEVTLNTLPWNTLVLKNATSVNCSAIVPMRGPTASNPIHRGDQGIGFRDADTGAWMNHPLKAGGSLTLQTDYYSAAGIYQFIGCDYDNHDPSAQAAVWQYEGGVGHGTTDDYGGVGEKGKTVTLTAKTDTASKFGLES